MGLEDFCGSPFWDVNLTWNTDVPDFTPCFQQTVLVWIPCGFLWLFTALEAYFLLNSKARYIPWTALNIAKTILNLLLILLMVADLGYAIHRNSKGYDVYPVAYLTPAIKLATLVLALSLLLINKQRGIRSSGILFIFWFLLAVTGAITYRSKLLDPHNMPDEDVFPFVTYMIYYPFVVAMLFINCFSDAPPQYLGSNIKTDNPCPQQSSSFLSYITYAWFDSMAWKGYRKSLEMADLWDLNPEDVSGSVVPTFDKHWENSIRKKAQVSDPKIAFNRQKGVEFKKGTETRKPISIFPALCKAFGPAFLAGALLKLVQDLLTFVSPQVLKALISFVSSDEDQWKGFLYAGLLTVTAIVQTLFLSQYFQKMFVIGMRIRTAVVSAVYRKALRISNSARKESTVGEIVNLMSVDAQRFMDLTTYLNMIWSAPLQIALALYFLWNLLGPSVLSGLVVMILLIPINGVIANQTKKLQVTQMKYKDKRVKVMNEILGGIKVLKLYAWEPSFQHQVEGIREQEIEVLKKAAYLSAGTSFIWTCAPFLVSLFTFMVYVLVSPDNVLDAEKAFVSLTLFNIMRYPMSLLPMLIVFIVQVSVVTFATYVLSSEDHVLNAETAFVALALFNLLRFPLSMLPMCMTSIISASVSLKRMNKFMNAEELDDDAVIHDQTSPHPVVVENGSFSWSAEDPPSLKNINIEIKDKSLVAVVGQVGAGKSSLVSAFLGEMEKLSGKVVTRGRIAYVPQQAWIQNTTLKENILFGKPFDPTQYEAVIEACALKPDLAMLPGGDATEIGEKGINLSGGQKQRVSLARAVYSDLDVYFLDDPLSAVDSHVGKHIFEKVIGPQGLLKDKTRVLVTHGITYLPQVDNIIVLKDGEVSETGSYKQLMDHKGAFAEFLLTHLQETNEEVEDGDELNEIKQQLASAIGKEEFARQLSRQKSRLSESEPGSPEKSLDMGGSKEHVDDHERNGSLRRRRSSSQKEKSPEPQTVAKPPVVGQKLIEVEKAETGRVKSTVYVYYLKAVGGWLSFWTLFLYAVFQAFSVAGNVWLSVWSNANVTQQNEKRDFYLGVYGGLGIGQASAVMVGTVLMSLATLKAGFVLHSRMFSNVMRNPTTFFDTTPAGRILNRVSKDVDTLDNTLNFVLRGWITTCYQVVATVLVISYSTPIFLTIVLPIGVVYYFMQHFYVATSRQLKRLESVSRSPIYSHFGETITGASVIRAYGQQQRFVLESEHRVDVNQICYYPSIIANRWLSVRLETMGNFVVFFAALFAVLGRDTLDPGTVGLSISYALNVTQVLNWFMRMTSEVETNIVAVERIKEYTETPQEAPWEIAERKPAPQWPEKGRVEFKNYQLRYREGLDLVLKGISCEIEGGEKIGIVGRTGAGKSSLTLGLFRLIEAAGGSILIDGLDISTIGLHSLRSRLTIIPQDPVLFSGTLRLNLDPFNKYSDDDVWRVLEHAHLKSFVKGLAAGLEHEVSEGGENLSVGQRQLICLARALLRKTKVLILDEATAAVDLETDDLIQATIRKEFVDCTVLTIAHRLNTIMDSTRVLVLDKGEVKEFDSPSNLLAQKKSIFYGMARDAGLV